MAASQGPQVAPQALAEVPAWQHQDSTLMGTWAALLQEGHEHRRSRSPQTLDSLSEPAGHSQAGAQEPCESRPGESQGVEGQREGSGG